MMMSSRSSRSRAKRRPGTSRYMPLASARSPIVTARSVARASLRGSGSGSVGAARSGSGRMGTARGGSGSASLGRGGSGSASLERGGSGTMSMPELAVKRRPPVDLVLVKGMLQRLVEQRPSKDSDQFRHVFRLFGRPKNGVTWQIFQRQVHTRLGIIMTDDESKALFAMFDKKGKGTLSLPEVVTELLPPDYTAPSWNMVRDEEMTRQEMDRTAKFVPYEASVPSSLKSTEWRLQDFILQLQTKIIERTKRPSDQFREAYVVFGKPEKGLTRAEFRDMVFRLGIVVTEEQLDVIFKHFDTDKNGVLSFEELCRKVIEPDYTAKLWMDKRDEELSATLASRATEAHDTTLKRWPTTLKDVKPTLNQLKEQLAAKILERTKRANDQYREAFQLFGSPADGIQFKDFKHQLRSLGIVASSKALKALFKVLDVNNNGYLSFQELVSQVLPKDYTAETWVERADRVAAEAQRQREARFNPILEKWPAALATAPLSDADAVKLIQAKIVERTKRPEDQYREAFKVFGSPHGGLTEAELGAVLQRLGVLVTSEQLHRLFTQWDENSNGVLEFSEFVAKVMEPDYTAKSWYIVADERAVAAMERTRQEVLAESPFAPRRQARPATDVGGEVKQDASQASQRSSTSRFSTRDLDELLTPVPQQVIDAGMRDLKAHAGNKHAKSRRRHRSKRGQVDVSMPLASSRVAMTTRPAAATVVKPLRL